MAEHIDRKLLDELVKDLRYEAYFAYLGEDGNRLSKMMIESADTIEELSRVAEVNAKRALKWASDAEKAEKKLRWIPVTERLPDNPQNVLVTDGKCVGMGWLDTYVRKDTGEVLRDWFAPNTAVIENKITHWRPLPTPPKEDKL